MKINPKQFFTRTMFHHKEAEHPYTTLALSILLGVFTLGTAHLICFFFLHRSIKFISTPDMEQRKSNRHMCYLIANKFLHANNQEQAIVWFAKAAELGEPYALKALKKFNDKKAIPSFSEVESKYRKSHQEEMEYFELHPPKTPIEKYLVGSLLLAEGNREKAIELFSCSAAEGELFSMSELKKLNQQKAISNFSQIQAAYNAFFAKEIAKKEANQDLSPIEMLNMGYNYRQIQNNERAFYWFEQAALLGNRSAMKELERVSDSILNYEEIKKKNYEIRIAKLLPQTNNSQDKSPLEKCLIAQEFEDLGFMIEAIDWYVESAREGDMSAFSSLKRMRIMGTSIEKWTDIKKSYKAKCSEDVNELAENYHT